MEENKKFESKLKEEIEKIRKGLGEYDEETKVKLEELIKSNEKDLFGLS